MHMTFEKIEQPPAPEPEHPAHRAARMIKELHEKNIAMIDSGHVFERAGINVNAEIRAACVQQIALCDAIMQRSHDMSPKLMEFSAEILHDVEQTLERTLDGGTLIPELLPQIGEYGHDENTQPDGLHDDGRPPSDDR